MREGDRHRVAESRRHTRIARWNNSYTPMRFKFDAEKSRAVLKKHGVGLEEAREVFDQAYLMDRRNDDPEQFRAIGWSRGRLSSVIFEIRQDSGGDFCHLITAWKATPQEEQAYAEQI